MGKRRKSQMSKSRWTDSTKDLGSVLRTSGWDTPSTVEELGGLVRLSRSGGATVDETRARWTQIFPEAYCSLVQSDSLRFYQKPEYYPSLVAKVCFHSHTLLECEIWGVI